MFEFQSMEPRRLLANASPISKPAAGEATGVTPTAILNKEGVLEVIGTTGAERIEINKAISSGRLHINVKPTDGRPQTSLPSFKAKDVKQIIVRGGNKKDIISLADVGGIPAVLDGGKGNDRISTTASNVTLVGGVGDDQLRSGTSLSGNGALRYVIHTPMTAGAYRAISNSDGSLQIVDKNGKPVSEVGITFDRIATRLPLTVAYQGALTGTLIESEAAYTVTNTVNGSFFASMAISATRNQLNGGDGNDTFESSGGDDSIIGGSGDDTFTPQAGNIETRFDDLEPANVGKRDKTRPSRVAVFGIESVKSNASSVSVVVNV